MLHVRLTKLHAAHQNLSPAIRTLRLKETVQNIHQQDAQLSQRDRAAGCVIVFAKSRPLELGDNILRTL